MVDCCKHHKSPYTNAAIVLCVIGFILNFTVPLALIPALFTMITVCTTMCCRVHKKCLLVTVALALLSSVCAFVVLAAVKRTGSEANNVLRIMSILGGIWWIGTAYVIYKIPRPDATANDPNAPTSSDPTSFDENPTV